MSGNYGDRSDWGNPNDRGNRGNRGSYGCASKRNQVFPGIPNPVGSEGKGKAEFDVV